MPAGLSGGVGTGTCPGAFEPATCEARPGEARPEVGAVLGETPDPTGEEVLDHEETGSSVNRDVLIVEPPWLVRWDLGEGEIERILETVLPVEAIAEARMKLQQRRDGDFGAKGTEPPAAVTAMVPSSRRSGPAPRAQ